MADVPVFPATPARPAGVPRLSLEERLLQESLLIEAEDACKAGALGFMARLLVQTTLPHSRQDSLSFIRTNGALQVSVSAHPLLGLPYGRYPRLLMAWVTTEAVRTREPVLKLGPSLTAFMADLGLLPRGGHYGPIGRLRDRYCQVSVVEARGGAVEGGRLQDSAGTRLLAPRAEGAISEHSVVG